MDPRADFQTADLVVPVRTSPQVIKKAKGNLKRMHKNGDLPPLPDWDGDILEGWLDLLGLNGRPISQRKPAGMRG